MMNTFHIFLLLPKIKNVHTISEYQNHFEAHLSKKITTSEPVNLYEPITYILNIGGKRLRPVLVLMSAEVFGVSHKEALDAALAIEVFHNFTLVHDDIMDAAPLRRGRETVHTKWDVNTGILSGDVMFITSYRLLEDYDGETFKQLNQLLTKTGIEVCEGQQYDIDFETRTSVTEQEYLKMIEYKTAVLVGAAMKMGAIIAKASDSATSSIYDFGRLLGIAFQLQDDYLDAFGDPATFGKQVGGDIIENKKTFLYIKALEFGSSEEQKQLEGLFSLSPEDPGEKITAVKSLFETTGARERTQLEIKKYTEKAFLVLDKLPITEEKKKVFRAFGENLMNRNV